MAIKFNNLKSFGYNWLNKIKYNSDYDQRLVQLLTRIGPRPILLNKDKIQVAVLENSFDVIIEQEVGGIDEISFTIPMTDSKRELIVNEGYIQMFDDIYIIREIIDKKKSKMTEIYAQALWYDLKFTEPVEVLLWETKSAHEMLTDMLAGTGWSVGTVVFSNKRSFKVDNIDENRLELIRKVESLFQGELWFDTQNKTVSLHDQNGIETGASIMYEKNADEIQAYYDTGDLITKLYLYGKENMTIKDANNGVEFIENYSYSTEKRVQIIKDERYTNPFQLKEMGEKALIELCKPQVRYEILGQLSEQTGLEHEKFAIGGIVRVYDKELNLNNNTRIMKWSYNVVEPWKTQVNLESKAKSLSDLLTGSSLGIETLSSEEAIKGEMLNLSVFNYLMNSRADDGYSYWTNNGWVIDTINGSTGGASFKASGAMNQEKILHQTVYPSSAEDYAISFKAFADNIVLGPNGQIGVEIVITYEDDTTSAPIFIKLV